MKYLKLSDELSLPLSIAGDTQAVLAQKGKGKTYLAMKLAEGLADGGQQFVAIDPTGVWWGLTADGEGAGGGKGVPCLVMGGEHGHVPLESTSGELVAEFVVTSGQSVIVDISLMRKAEGYRFLGAFLDKLYHFKATHREPLHILWDEADMAAPQKPGPEQTKVLGAAEDCVRRGRSRGLGMTLLTQRPAVLNKNLLEMADTLFILGMTGQYDIEAVTRRVAVDGTKEQVAALTKSLPSLARGEAWVWSPGTLKEFKRFTVGRKRTFDSSRTPAPGERVAEPRARAAVDLAKLSAEIRATAERAKENDPATLRKKIAELERKLAAPVAAVPPSEPIRVEIPVVSAEAMAALERMAEEVGKLRAEVTAVKLRAELNPPLKVVLSHRWPQEKQATTRTAPLTRPPATRPVLKVGAGGGDTELGAGERKILTAIAQLGAQGPVTREQISVMCEYKRSSRDTYLQKLKQKGYIDDVDGREGLCVTSAGLEALGADYEPLPTGRALQAYWMGQLPEGEAKILKVCMHVYPNPLDRNSLDDTTGYKRSSRDTYLQKLASRRLITIEGRGMVRASDHLF